MNNKIIEDGQLEGEFNGFNNTDTIFKFIGGGRWQQAEYKYYYYYSYMPSAKVIEKNGKHIIKIDCVDETVEVISA